MPLGGGHLEGLIGLGADKSAPSVPHGRITERTGPDDSPLYPLGTEI